MRKRVAAISLVGFLGALLPAAPVARGADPFPETASAVRAFTQHMAEDVTRRGPAAWSDYLANSPAFFMASEGSLVFANGGAMTRGVKDLVAAIAKIELVFGKDLRVEALTPSLAMVAATYQETRVDKAGKRVDEKGYFTGLAEKGSSGWQFRNAHWSVVAGAPAAP